MAQISVIIPTHNRSKYISKAIKSALDQTYKDFEIVIVDDGSIDNTEAVVSVFGSKRNGIRIKYIKHKKNMGVAAARNTGIINSTGKYVTFLSSDDRWLPTKLEKQYALFQRPKYDNLGVVSVNVIYRTPRAGKKAIGIFLMRGNLYPQILQDGLVFSPLIKRECFQRCGFYDQSLSHGEDWDFHIRLSKKYNFDFVVEPLIICLIHKKQLSASFLKRAEGHAEIVKKYFTDYQKYPKILAHEFGHIGSLYIRSGNLRQGRNFLILSMKERPLYIKIYLHLLLSFLGVNIYRKIVNIKRRLKGEIPLPYYEK